MHADWAIEPTAADDPEPTSPITTTPAAAAAATIRRRC